MPRPFPDAYKRRTGKHLVMGEVLATAGPDGVAQTALHWKNHGLYALYVSGIQRKQLRATIGLHTALPNGFQNGQEFIRAVIKPVWQPFNIRIQFVSNSNLQSVGRWTITTSLGPSGEFQLSGDTYQVKDLINFTRGFQLVFNNDTNPYWQPKEWVYFQTTQYDFIPIRDKLNSMQCIKHIDHVSVGEAI